MTVYVVLCGDYEGAEVRAVCSTKERAKQLSSDFVEIDVD